MVFKERQEKLLRIIRIDFHAFKTKDAVIDSTKYRREGEQSSATV